MQPLAVAIVWHMHQPYYKDLRSGSIPLPWVRLHAAKDYLHMAEVLGRFPEVHLTINMVPSLTEQMLSWAEGREVDDLARIAEQETWSDEDKSFILNLCFSVNWDNIIRRYPRYAGLLDRRPAVLADPAAFSDEDYRDLVAWFNLAWIDENWLERDPELRALVQRGHGFTIADIRGLHAKQRAIAAAVIPAYRRLAGTGQLEISTTPYYHPILPLLVDTGSAQRASPGLPLPKPPFRAPDDVATQLALAVEAHTAHFGAAPRGLWPSEGAVSPEILPDVRAAGFNWLATDEVILARSLGRPIYRDSGALLIDPRMLYQPYRVMAGSEPGPYIIFRDHELSDRVGFLYQHLPGEQAAEDMIYRLLEIRRRINDPASPYLVSIILDGENCWEHYEHNGDIFLNAFYGELERRSELRAVTVSEFIQGRRPAATLARLATGSWIGGDLTTWIGDPEHNRAWEALGRTRADLARTIATPHSGKERPSDEVRARHLLYAAEGSDWFWWYSHRNSSDQDALFDRLFRHTLQASYEAIGSPVPHWLTEPIQRVAQTLDRRPVTGYVTPSLTAASYPGEAWSMAAQIRPSSDSTGTMQRAVGLIERLFAGHDQSRLFLRLDLREPVAGFTVQIYGGGGDTTTPANQLIDAAFHDMEGPRDLAASWLIRRDGALSPPFLYRADGHGGWSASGPVMSAAGEKVLEFSLPLVDAGLELGDELRLYMALVRDGQVVAALPERSMADLPLTAF